MLQGHQFCIRWSTSKDHVARRHALQSRHSHMGQAAAQRHTGQAAARRRPETGSAARRSPGQAAARTRCTMQTGSEAPAKACSSPVVQPAQVSREHMLWQAMQPSHTVHLSCLGAFLPGPPVSVLPFLAALPAISPVALDPGLMSILGKIPPVPWAHEPLIRPQKKSFRCPSDALGP